MIVTPRLTLKQAVKFEGLGLHSGQPVSVVVQPGDGGIWFRHGADRVEALAANVTDTSRCTRLGTISTIEHLMSALAALEVTDAEVELSFPELPGMDGSAAPFYDGLSDAGLEKIGDAEHFPPFKRVFFQEGPLKIAGGKGEGLWRYEYSTESRWPFSQAFEVLGVVENYREQIAPARTFVLTEELPMIEKYGLGKGLDVNSALVLGPEGFENAARFTDEPARHKLLDLIGDVYLSGIPVRLLNLVAERSGHRTNVHFAVQLAEAEADQRGLAKSEEG